MTPADLVKLARAAKSGKKVTSGLSAAKEAATISNMQQAGELPLPKLINTPQSEALKLAQERAALPVSKGGLGLPKNNTPAQRAKAMGFDKDRYHGTLRNIKKLDPRSGSTESHAGKGVYSTDSAEDASRNYASIYGPDVSGRVERGMDDRDKDWRKIHSRMKDEVLTPRQQEIILQNTVGADNIGVVYPLKVRSDKSIHLDKPEKKEVTVGPFQYYDEANDAWVDTPHTEKFNEALDEFRELGGDANPIYEAVQNYNEAMPASELFRVIKKEGDSSGLYDPYTGDIVSGGVAAGEFMKHFGIDEIRHTPSFKNQELNIGTEHTISLDPDNVRSRFAAFDPFRKDVATATAMGVAAPDLLAKEEESKEEKSRKAQGGLAHMSGGGTPEPKRKSILDLTPLTEAAAAVQNAFKAERGTYGDKGATMDILNRGIVADTLGGAADLANLPLQGLDWLQSNIPGLSKPASVMDVPSTSPRLSNQPNTTLKFPLSTDKPFGGSEAWKELFQKSGVTSKTERPAAEISTSLLAPLAPVVASKAAKVAKAVAPRAGNLAYQFMNKQAEAMGLPLEMGVVKPKGGNWLAGESERLTKPMKWYVPSEESLLRAEVEFPVEAAEARASSIPNAILNKWIDKKLNSYIKNEMGTPEDQIRLGIERRAAEAETLKETNQAKLDKMAAAIERNKAAGKDTTLTERDLAAAKEQFDEDYQIASQGLYHGTVPEGGWMGGNVWEPQILAYKREKEGFPKGGMGTHPAARQWEFASDAEINSTPAGQFVGDGMPESYYDRTNSLAKDYNQKVLDQNPWLSKVDPETKVYKLDEMNPDVGLEFRHMIDEVKTAMDPASNLPKHLKIAAKDLEKMTVDDVSALSGKISAWRNAQIGKPNLELANNPAVSLYKEYPTANNPKGVSWRQIKRPEGLPDEEADKALRDAIGYEGDIMRHCVGGSGHCEPLLRGDTEVYSLRDAKGEPHVTIEVGPDDSIFGFKFAKENYPELYAQYSANKDKYFNSWRDFLAKEAPELLENLPKQIIEIKGKNNRKPKDEYIPFIQDFIKSGNWSNVGDIHHTDLHKVGSEYFTEPEFVELTKKYGRIGVQNTTWEVARQRHLDQGISEEDALSNWVEAFKEGRGKLGRLDMPPKPRPEGMKRGGAVRMAEGGQAPSNWTDYLSQHAQEESMRLMGGDTALNPMKDGGSIDDMIRKAVEKANSRNYASGGASLIESQEGLAPYGLRHSGEGAKGKGYFGGMSGKHGMVTELSTESEGIGEHPLIVPTLTREELEYLLAGGDPTESIYKKARQHAEGRKSKGKGSFADPSELRQPKPEYADGGVVNIDDLIQKAITLRNQHA